MDPIRPMGRRQTVEFAALERFALSSRVVVIDVDSALLKRAALSEVVSLLFRSGVIGPIRWCVEQLRARGSVQRGEASSAVYARGLTPDDLRRLLVELAADLAATAHSGMCAAIEAHASAGDFVVLNGIAPRELISALAVELGAHRGCGATLLIEEGVFTGGIEDGTTDEAVDRALGSDSLSSAMVYGVPRRL